jgi:hypothetical protein
VVRPFHLIRQSPKSQHQIRRHRMGNSRLRSSLAVVFSHCTNAADLIREHLLCRYKHSFARCPHLLNARHSTCRPHPPTLLGIPTHATTRVSLPHPDLVHLLQPHSDEFPKEHGHNISSLSFVSSSAQYLMIAPRTPTTSSTAHTPGSTSAFKSHRKDVENGQRRPHMPGPAESMMLMLTCSPMVIYQIQLPLRCAL